MVLRSIWGKAIDSKRPASRLELLADGNKGKTRPIQPEERVSGCWPLCTPKSSRFLTLSLVASMTWALPRFRSKELVLQGHSSAGDRYLVPECTLVPGRSIFVAHGTGGNVGVRSRNVRDGQ